MSDFQVEIRGRVLWFRLTRPEARNALSASIVEGLASALSSQAARQDVRVVVITGQGESFCAGGDLKLTATRSDRLAGPDELEAMMQYLSRIGEVFSILEEFPKPTIAAVNGWALAGGLELALCCDIIVASSSARLGDVHTNLGLIPGAGATLRLPRRVGAGRAKYFIYTGDHFSAEYCEQLGLVNLVISEADFETRADELAQRLSEKSPLALRQVKALVNQSFDSSVKDGLAAELAASRVHATTEDYAEGIAAFSEKRLPNFSGR